MPFAQLRDDRLIMFPRDTAPEVYDGLIGVFGGLTAGAQLREVELSTAFGVARHSLRAALQVLVHDGVLRREPSRGVFVPQFSPGDVEDLFQLRIALEMHTARVLAERRVPIPHAAAAVDRMEALHGSEPWNEVTDLDLGFHRALVNALAAQRITKTFASLEAEFRLLLAHMQYQYVRPDKIGAEHRLVLDAIVSRSPAHAVRAMRHHFDVGIDDVLEALKTVAERGSTENDRAG